MNCWTKSLVAVSLLSGSLLTAPTLFCLPAGAVPTATLPAPAPAQDALIALAARLDSSLPTGTKLLSIRVTDDLATANFSHQLRDNFSGGDTEETLTVNALLRTLGQFPTISRVQILVEGKPIDSLGGLLSLSDPLPVIRPDTDPASAPARRFHRKAKSNA